MKIYHILIITLFTCFWTINTSLAQVEETTQPAEEEHTEGQTIVFGPDDNIQDPTQPEEETYVSYKRNRELKTLFGHGRQGFYGALSTACTQIDNKYGLSVSARGTWLVDRSFGIGIGGTGFINQAGDILYWLADSYPLRNNTLTGGYGGVIVEPILLPRFPVHLSFPVLLGVGAVSTVDELYYQGYFDVNDVFLVAEPHVELEFNLTHFARFGLFGSYRFTTKLNSQTISEQALKGLSAGVILKLGLFR